MLQQIPPNLANEAIFFWKMKIHESCKNYILVCNLKHLLELFIKHKPLISEEC